MNQFHLESKPPTTAQHMHWTKLDDGNWQSGSVQIRLIEYFYTGDYRHENWGIWINADGHWMQCYVKSRPWLYGSVGQAKIGVSRASELIFGNPKKGK